MVDVVADLEARGLLQDSTDIEALRARLAEGPITLYYGCDPTAD
ncbi:MAG: tyrosyl-tRNA synthetase, partial [Actinomycetota bacterium]